MELLVRRYRSRSERTENSIRRLRRSPFISVIVILVQVHGSTAEAVKKLNGVCIVCYVTNVVLSRF